MEIRPDEPDAMYCTRRALSRVLEIFVGAELSRVYLLKFVKRGDDLNGTQSLRFSAGNPNRASRGVRAARLCRNARRGSEQGVRSNVRTGRGGLRGGPTGVLAQRSKTGVSTGC